MSGLIGERENAINDSNLEESPVEVSQDENEGHTLYNYNGRFYHVLRDFVFPEHGDIGSWGFTSKVNIIFVLSESSRHQCYQAKLSKSSSTMNGSPL